MEDTTPEYREYLIARMDCDAIQEKYAELARSIGRLRLEFDLLEMSMREAAAKEDAALRAYLAAQRDGQP